MTQQIKEQLEEVIKKNLPEKKRITADKEAPFRILPEHKEIESFNQALSQINTSLIADEVLRVVREREKKLENMSNCYAKIIEDVYDGEKIEVADKKRRKEYGLD